MKIFKVEEIGSNKEYIVLNGALGGRVYLLGNPQNGELRSISADELIKGFKFVDFEL